MEASIFYTIDKNYFVPIHSTWKVEHLIENAKDIDVLLTTQEVLLIKLLTLGQMKKLGARTK